MKKNRDISYLLIPNMDGITTAFPVSKHVLDTSKTHPREDAFYGKVRRAIPTLARPATSLAILLCVWTMSIGSSYAGSPTLAYFRDSESSKQNVFGAGSLNFDLNPGEVTVPIAAGTPLVISPRFIPENGSFPVTYRIFAELVSDPNTFCSRLYASGTSSPYLYSGPLLSLETSPATTTGYGHVDISVSDATGLVAGMECTVDVVYRGWHSETPENTGYSDEERDRFTFVFDAPVEAAANAAGAQEILEPVPEEPVTPLDETAEAAEDTVSEAENPAEETPAEEPLPDASAPAEPVLEPVIEPETVSESEMVSDVAPEATAANAPTE